MYLELCRDDGAQIIEQHDPATGAGKDLVGGRVRVRVKARVQVSNCANSNPSPNPRLTLAPALVPKPDREEDEPKVERRHCLSKAALSE